MNRQWLRNFFLFHVHNHCKSSTFKSKALQSISYCNFGEVLLVSMRIHRDTQQTKDWFSKDSNKDLQEKKIRRSFDTKKGKGGFIVYNYPMDILSTSQLPPGIGTHSFTVSSPWGECNADYSWSWKFTITIVSLYVPPGTHHCWVDRGNEDSKLAQGFYAWPVPPGIEPQTSWSVVQRLNHKATHSTIL